MRRVLGGAALLAVLLTARSAADTERFYTFMIEGRRVGYGHYRIEQTPEGRKTTSDTLIKVSLLGTPYDLSYQAVLLETPDGKKPRRSALTFRRGADTVTAECRVQGAKALVTTTATGSTQTKTFPWTADTHLVEGNSMETWNALFRRLGTNPAAKSFHGLMLLGPTVETMRLTRGRPETLTAQGRAWRCDSYALGEGLNAVQFLVARDTREIIEFRVPAQKAVVRLADRAAMKDVGNFEALTRAFALTDAKFGDPAALTFVRLRINAAIVGEKVAAATLQTPTQKFTGTAKNGRIRGILEIRPFRYNGTNAPSFPGAATTDRKLAKYLKPEPNVESDAPEIRTLAKELTAGAKTRWEAVRRIGEWVHQNIAYTITGAGAKQCLATKKGDCGPHTWLTIALCRAAGIPARITGGALYSGALGGSFGQHYWTKVWMGPDGWVPLDTTTGEIGTLSPLHLTLWNLGGIGSLSVQVLDFAPKPFAAPPVARPAPRAPIAVAQGEKERYVFRMDGKVIGEQTAECVRADADGSEWKYALRLQIGSGTAPVRVTMEGTLTVGPTAAPRTLTADVEASGAKQKIAYAFQPEKALVTMDVGGQVIKREAARGGAEFLQMNNLLTPLSLAARVLRLAPGQKLTAPFFAAGGMQRLDLTFTALPQTETIRVGSRDVECVVCDVAPIANRFYLARDTGALLRLTVPAQKIVISREE